MCAVSALITQLSTSWAKRGSSSRTSDLSISSLLYDCCKPQYSNKTTMHKFNFIYTWCSFVARFVLFYVLHPSFAAHRMSNAWSLTIFVNKHKSRMRAEHFFLDLSCLICMVQIKVFIKLKKKYSFFFIKNLEILLI